MNTTAVGTTVRVGNHRLTPEEQAAGAPERLPFVDEAGDPVDPDAVALALLAATGQARTFGYPEPGPGDTGALTRQEAGRYYVDWTPAAAGPLGAEDGLWRWALQGAMTPGTSQSDQDVFYVKRPLAAAP